jgi:hypothetical protein
VADLAANDLVTVERLPAELQPREPDAP